MKDISVIIPTYQHKDRDIHLGLLLDTLLVESNLKYINEILIIDNGCALDGSSFETQSAEIKIIKEPLLGLNNARNCGISNASGFIFAFLDDDVTVSKDWSKGIYNGYNNRGVLCVGGSVSLGEYNLKLPNWLSDYFKRFLFPPNFPENSGILKLPYYLIGANMSFKKEVFDKFGLFNSELDRKGNNLLSNGDTEFIIRLPTQSIWYSDEARVSTIVKIDRFTRFFMIKRLFWQGISDYIMVKENGTSNFYDKNEIFFSNKFLKIFFHKLVTLKLFEVFCIVVRIVGFRMGIFYIKEKRG